MVKMRYLLPFRAFYIAPVCRWAMFDTLLVLFLLFVNAAALDETENTGRTIRPWRQ